MNRELELSLKYLVCCFFSFVCLPQSGLKRTAPSRFFTPLWLDLDFVKRSFKSQSLHLLYCCHYEAVLLGVLYSSQASLVTAHCYRVVTVPYCPLDSSLLHISLIWRVSVYTNRMNDVNKYGSLLEYYRRDDRDKTITYVFLCDANVD